MELNWYNYITEEYETGDVPIIDEEAIKYIPQIPAAQGLYRIYRKMGQGILEAMERVLQACVGEKETNIERK